MTRAKEPLPVATVLGRPRERLRAWWAETRDSLVRIARAVKYAACGLAISIVAISLILVSVSYTVDTCRVAHVQILDCTDALANVVDVTEVVQAVVGGDPSRDLKTLEDRYGEVIVTCLHAEAQKVIGTKP